MWPFVDIPTDPSTVDSFDRFSGIILTGVLILLAVLMLYAFWPLLL